MTDLKYALDVAVLNVQKNINMNSIKKNQIEVRALDWFDEKMINWSEEELESIDVIVAADVIWQEVLIVPLANTIVRLLAIMERGRRKREMEKERGERGERGERERESNTVVLHKERCYCYVMYTSRYGEKFDAMVLDGFQGAGLVVEKQPHDEMDPVYRYDEAVVWSLHVLHT